MSSADCSVDAHFPPECKSFLILHFVFNEAMLTFAFVRKFLGNVCEQNIR